MNTAANISRKVYCQSMVERISEYKEDLNDLTQIINERSLSKHEYNSAERLLQVLVESCIGLSKHWVKSLDKTVPTEAYLAIEKLTQLQYLDESESINWRKIIGMRNALVHDYLNIDKDIIKHVIRNKHYESLFEFADKAIEHLSK